MPFITAAVFLSAEDLACRFDEVQQSNVYGREGLQKQTGLPGIWSGLIDQPASRRPDPDFMKNVTRLMEKTGAKTIDRGLNAGEYELEQRAFDSGQAWTD